MSKLTPPSMDIGSRVSNLRLKNKISQEELAKRLNVDRSSLSRLENGKRKVSTDELTILSKFFNKSSDYFLGIDQTSKCISPKDSIDLKTLLDGNLNTNMNYDGDNLTREQAERLKLAMTQIFWEKRQKERKRTEKYGTDK